MLLVYGGTFPITNALINAPAATSHISSSVDSLIDGKEWVRARKAADKMDDFFFYFLLFSS